IRRFSSIEPDGILNAWKTKVRAKVAKMTAISRASRYSRATGFRVVSFDISYRTSLKVRFQRVFLGPIPTKPTAVSARLEIVAPRPCQLPSEVSPSRDQ